MSPALIISSAASSESDARRHPLDRPVVQVARDAVALGLDRRVRPAQQPRAVLVAVLQELEQRADRLVGHAARRSRRAPASACAGGSLGISEIRDSRYSGWPSVRWICGLARVAASDANAASAPVDGGRERGPRLALDRRRGRARPSGERLVRADDRRRARRARRCRRPRRRTRAAGAPRTRAGSRSPRARARARGRSRAARPPCRRAPPAHLACAWVLATWFARMRAATPPPSSRISAVDCRPLTPRGRRGPRPGRAPRTPSTTAALVSTGPRPSDAAARLHACAGRGQPGTASP